MIMRHPSRNIMNELERSILSLYSYDPEPDNIEIDNILMQSVRLIGYFPSIIANAYAVKRHYFDGDSLHIHFPVENLSTAENFLRMMRPDKSYTDEEAKPFALSVMQHMNDACKQWKQMHNIDFSLYGTPLESTTDKFAKCLQQRFGIIPGVTDREYYTNSFHVPVYYHCTAFHKLSVEAPYHALTNGGHISYVEMDGDPLKNLDAFEKIVRYMHDIGIGYGSINHPVDRDPLCGYNGIIDDTCPCCHRGETTRVTERMKRIKVD